MDGLIRFCAPPPFLHSTWKRMTALTLALVSLLCCTVFSLDSGPGLPRFTVEPQSAVVRLQSAVTITCSAVSQFDQTPATIRWTLNGVPLTQLTAQAAQTGPGGKQRKVYDVRDGTLRIASFGPAQEGVYQCIAANSVGAIVSAEARLEVATLGTFEAARAVTDIVALKGNVAVVPCSSPPSKPSAVIEFELNGTKLTPSHVGPDPSPLTVIWAPQESVTFVQDSDLTLECAAEGFPVPVITWEKYGGHLPVGRFVQTLGNLEIKGAQKFDAGTYLCIVNNSVGQIQQKVVSVDVLERPVIEVPPSDQNVTEGGTIIFKCRSQAAAKASIVWKYNGNTPVNGQFVQLRDTTLTLSNVQLRQSGAYQCIAKNNIGTVYATARLTVIDPLRSSSSSSSSSASSSTGIGGGGKPGLPGYAPGKGVKDDYEEDDEDEDDDDGDDNDEGYGSVDETKPPRYRKPAPPGSEGGTGREGKSGRGEDTSVTLPTPTRPEVNKMSETALMIRWTVPPGTPGTPSIVAFKLLYKDLSSGGGGGVGGGSGGEWLMIDADIAPTRRFYEVTSRLRSGSSYRFRVDAVYSNHESRSSQNSAKIVLGNVQQSKGATTPGPFIVDASALSASEIVISWQQQESEHWPISGFHIYYAPFDEEVKYQKMTVTGANVRRVILSHLIPGTYYSIRAQSYSGSLESDFGNTVVKQTLSYSNDSPSDSSRGVGGASHPGSGEARGTGSTLRHDGPDLAPFAAEEHGRGAVGGGGSTGRGSDGQLYIILGVVLGVVVIVAVACAAICVWKQHLQQKITGSSKECKKLRSSDQSETFTDVATLKPFDSSEGQMKMGGGGGAGCYQLKINGSHLPGCGGKCSGEGVHGNGACMANMDGLRLQQMRLGTKKGAPDFVPPPPPPVVLPPTHLLGVTPSSSYYSPVGDGNHSGVNNGHSLSSPIYTKLPDPDADDTRSSNASDRQRNQAPAPLHPHSGGQYQPPYPRSSPDHIPRSHEQHPYMVSDLIRRHNPVGTGSSGSGGSGGNRGGGGAGEGLKERTTPERLPHGGAENGVQFSGGRSFNGCLPPQPMQTFCPRFGDTSRYYATGHPMGVGVGVGTSQSEEAYSSMDERPMSSSRDSLNTMSLGTAAAFVDSLTSLETPDLYPPPGGAFNHHSNPLDYPPPPRGRNVLINPADYQCRTDGRGRGTDRDREALRDGGWRSLAEQVSDGTYNLSAVPSAGGKGGGGVGGGVRNGGGVGPISASLALPRVNDYPSSDQEDYR